MGLQLIETITVGSGGAASIEFTSIPQDGVDLVLVLSVRQNDAGSDFGGSVRLKLNESATGYYNKELKGNGSSVFTSTDTNTTRMYFGMTPGALQTANTFSNGSFYFSNYTSSQPKSVSIDYVGENNASTAQQGIIAALWDNSSAITEIQLEASFNLAQYTTASLYIVS